MEPPKPESLDGESTEEQATSPGETASEAEAPGRPWQGDTGATESVAGPPVAVDDPSLSPSEQQRPPVDGSSSAAAPSGGGRLRRFFRGVKRAPGAVAAAARGFVQDPIGFSHRSFIEARTTTRQYMAQPLTFWVVFPPLLVLTILVFTRSFYTNYIFDEQEALLANPYVNGVDLTFWDVLKRDFWGLPPERTIASYRPMPNVIWWLTWRIKHTAWFPHAVNVLLHGVNAALIASLCGRWMNSRKVGWFAGLAFALSAIITEAVAGVVGLADVLGGTFILLCLWSLRLRWYTSALTSAVFLFLGFLCKESTLSALPVVAWAALVLAPVVHPARPRRFLRFVTMALAAGAALVAYTYLRRHFFPVKVPPDYEKPLADSEPFVKWVLHEFLRWFRQPKFSADPINNPLVDAEPLYRAGGALRVYFRSLVQVVFPWQLSADYSFPQEPVPKKLLTPEIVLGGLAMAGAPLLAIGCWLKGVWSEFGQRFKLGNWSPEALAAASEFERDSQGRLSFRSPGLRALALIAVGAMWVPVTYFPQSNIVMLLPTVRAERFWYLPIVGSTMLVALAFGALWRYGRRKGLMRWVWVVTLAYFGFQGVRARMHALDYRNDLVFWEATAKAVPNSAKAHLNYGVMLGARNRLEERRVENKRALELAPEWPMANIYYGDTLCRLHRPDEAMPHYLQGFELGPNQQHMVALALQCLWDEKAFERHKKALQEKAKAHPGSWVAFLVNDMVKNGETNKGVDPQYRPRGYNQGPKDKKKSKEKSKANKEAAKTASQGSDAATTGSQTNKGGSSQTQKQPRATTASAPKTSTSKASPSRTGSAQPRTTQTSPAQTSPRSNEPSPDRR